MVTEGNHEPQTDGAAKYLCVGNGVEKRCRDFLSQLRIPKCWDRLATSVHEIEGLGSREIDPAIETWWGQYGGSNVGATDRTSRSWSFHCERGCAASEYKSDSQEKSRTLHACLAPRRTGLRQEHTNLNLEALLLQWCLSQWKITSLTA